MAKDLGFRDVIDLPDWLPEVISPVSATAGTSFAYDHSGQDKHIYHLISNTVVNKYNASNNGWKFEANPNLVGTFGAGANAVYGCAGPSSYLKEGCTTSVLNLNSELCFPTSGLNPVVGAWTRSGTVATVNATHGLENNQYIVIQTTSDNTAVPLGPVAITYVTANQFTFTCLNAGATSGVFSYISAISNLSWSKLGTVVTVTHNNHGYITGQAITVIASSDTSAVPIGLPGGYAPPYGRIVVTGNNTYTTLGNLPGSPSGTMAIIAAKSEQELAPYNLGAMTWTRSGTTVSFFGGTTLISDMYVTIVYTPDNSVFSIGDKLLVTANMGSYFQVTVNDVGNTSGAGVRVVYDQPAYATHMGTVGTHYNPIHMAHISYASGASGIPVEVGASTFPEAIAPASYSLGICYSSEVYYAITDQGPAHGFVDVGRFVPTNVLKGYTIRVIGCAYNSSGLTEERVITGNSGGINQTITLNKPLSFVPKKNDVYVIFSGKLFLRSSGNPVEGSMRIYDIATNRFDGNHSVTYVNPNTTATALINLDAQYVPLDCVPGEGYFGNILATNTSSNTISDSGTASTKELLENEYRNFRIRIVKDTKNPSAVGQERIIISHTAGPGVTYTVTPWTFIPSTSATFVIENNDQLLVIQNTSGTYIPFSIGTFTKPSIMNTWVNSGGGLWTTNNIIQTYGSCGVGVFCCHPFAIPRSVIKNSNVKHSHVYFFRGGNSTTLDIIDISGLSFNCQNAIGSCMINAPYGSLQTGFNVGTCAAYDGVSNNGIYLYINLNGTNSFYRFNLLTQTMEPWTTLRYAVTGAVVDSRRMAVIPYKEQGRILTYLYTLLPSGAEMFKIPITR